MILKKWKREKRKKIPLNVPFYIFLMFMGGGYYLLNRKGYSHTDAYADAADFLAGVFFGVAAFLAGVFFGEAAFFS